MPDAPIFHGVILAAGYLHEWDARQLLPGAVQPSPGPVKPDQPRFATGGRCPARPEEAVNRTDRVSCLEKIASSTPTLRDVQPILRRAVAIARLIDTGYWFWGDQPHLIQETLQRLIGIARSQPDKICQPARRGRPASSFSRHFPKIASTRGDPEGFPGRADRS